MISILLAALAGSALPADAEATCIDAGPTMHAVADALRSRYVIIDKGAEAATRIEQRVASGQFDRICGAPDERARTLTTGLRFLLPDQHLRIAAGAPQDPDPPAEAPQDALEYGLGIGEVSRLPGGIGYLRIAAWLPVEWVRPRLESALDLLRGSKAIIIDVRGNGGGDGNTMNLVARSFLPAGAPQTLVGMDRSGAPHDYIEPAEPAWVRFASDLPLAVIIDGDSASASEALAFILQQEKRATIVGRRSAGAAYAVMDAVVLPGDFALYLPEYRGVSRYDGSDWEGGGVVPDVWAGAGEEKLTAWEVLRAATAPDTD
ncbi:S41 family peptidase [Sphingomicrobium arenosum]|uniref:S41 family peptidase n=1 Tax=Sphingomicrobium arenosum TaxID=2233861 RepID=UPI002240F1B7|nr:S41 family peptidase [Sphingomicrobium arenosum]